jgi:predicted TIM-barrel fold metal-dependent hydrolase
MTVIDIHGHIGTWHNFFIPQPSASWLTETSARIGIDTTGVSHLVALGFDTAVGNQMALAAAERSAGRLGVWLVANPHRAGDVELIREQLSAPHVWGLKLHPDVHEYATTDRGYAPYLSLAQELGVPVLSHGETRSPWSDPAQLAEVSDRYEGLPVLIGHSGLWHDSLDRTAGLATDHPGLYLELCGSRMTRLWIERLIATAGAEKVLFGSDACFLDPRLGLGKVLFARITERERELVLGGNALRILGERYRGNRETSD